MSSPYQENNKFKYYYVITNKEMKYQTEQNSGAQTLHLPTFSCQLELDTAMN